LGRKKFLGAVTVTRHQRGKNPMLGKGVVCMKDPSVNHASSDHNMIDNTGNNLTMFSTGNGNKAAA